MHRIFEQLFLLPIRSFLFGLGVMSETFRGLQKLGEESLGEIEGRPRDPTRAEGPKPTPAESLPAPASATIDPEVAETLFGRSEPSWSSTPRSPVLPGSSRLTEPMGFSGPETLAIRQPDPGGGPLPSEADPVPRTDPTENVSEEIYPIATKEEEKMYMDQDLSGDQVKVVQYSIVNVVPGIDRKSVV